MLYDVIVIGGGPGGYTAALYAARANLSVAILEKLSPGGQMGTTDVIDNYPGFPQGVNGFELAMQMKEGAERFGAQTQLAEVTQVELAGQVKTIHTSGGDYQARTVVLATGAHPRELGLPGERELRGRGVSYCATCDGGFYKGKTTVVIGGGNTAVEDALYLANICEEVHLIHRRDAFRAGKVLVDSLLSRENIVIHYDTVPVEVLPDESGKVVGALKVKNVKTGAETEIPAQGVFVAVGLVPDNKVFEGQVDLDPAGYIAAGEDTRTNLPGVFAAGDTRTKALRQIITAAGDGAVAASEAGSYLMQG